MRERVFGIAFDHNSGIEISSKAFEQVPAKHDRDPDGDVLIRTQ